MRVHMLLQYIIILYHRVAGVRKNIKRVMDGVHVYILYDYIGARVLSIIILVGY
jgi:hypothetical protein